MTAGISPEQEQAVAEALGVPGVPLVDSPCGPVRADGLPLAGGAEA